MSERLLSTLSKAVLVGGVLAAVSTPQRRSEFIDPFSQDASDPNSRRSAFVCGPNQMPHRESRSFTDGVSGSDTLFEVAQEMGEGLIQEDGDPQTEALILKNHARVSVNDGEEYLYGDIESLATSQPDAVPTLTAGDDVKIHVLFCGPLDPNDPTPQP